MVDTQKEIAIMFNPVYHVFCFFINGTWFRTPQVFDDAAFDELMEMLEWRMPYNMRVFHFTSDEQPPVSKNHVFLARPIVYVDLIELFKEKKGIRLKRNGLKPVAVLHLSGEYVIIETDDKYNRLLKCSESDDELFFEEFLPLPFALACDFVAKNHRHNAAPQSHKFSIGLLRFGKLMGVVIASTPKARALNDGFTLELNRCCVLPDQRNACSKLYAKAILAGRSMGYRKFVTYTQTHESGSSLKAVGFKLDGLTQARPNGWNCPSRPRKMPERYPTEQKCRWVLNV